MSDFGGHEISDELAGKEHISNLNGDVGALAKAYDESQSYLGRIKATSVELPKEGSEDAVWIEAREKFTNTAPDNLKASWTVPADAKGYGLQVPTDMDFAKEALEGRIGAYHKLGLSQGKAQALFESEVSTIREARTQAVAAHADKEAFFDQQLGNAKAQTLAAAQAAMTKFGGDHAEAMQTAIDGMPNETAMMFINSFKEMAQSLGEDNIQYLNAGRSMALTPEERDLRIEELQNHPLRIEANSGRYQSPEKVKARKKPEASTPGL